MSNFKFVVYYDEISVECTMYYILCSVHYAKTIE